MMRSLNGHEMLNGYYAKPVSDVTGINLHCRRWHQWPDTHPNGFIMRLDWHQEYLEMGVGISHEITE